MAKKKKAVQEPMFARLCLVTPAELDAAHFAPVLDSTLRSGDVASLILDLAHLDPDAALSAAERLVPIAQANGVAAIIAGDWSLVQASGADGVHVAAGQAELRRAVDTFHPDRIVGGGGLKTRHDAMLAGETDCDYLFFGRLDGDTADEIFDKALDMAAWWSVVFEIPAMVMGGRTLGSVIEAVDARVEFVVLRDAVWLHPEGPSAAVAEANRLIAARQMEAAP